MDPYPDARGGRARRALAAAWEVSVERVALGNGAAELLFTLVQLLCAGGRTLLAVDPMFSVAAAAASEACGARLASWRARRAGWLPGGCLRRWVGRRPRSARGAAVYLCNPQNPTGRVVPFDQVAKAGRGARGEGAHAYPGRSISAAFDPAPGRAMRRPWPRRLAEYACAPADQGEYAGFQPSPPARPGSGLAHLVEAAGVRPSYLDRGGAPAQAAIAACATPEAEAHITGVREKMACRTPWT